MSFSSKVFQTRTVKMVDREETIVKGGRDLFKLLNNFVSFRDFYRRKDKAIFQVGTLYLDQRSCDLCVRPADQEPPRGPVEIVRIDRPVRRRPKL